MAKISAKKRLQDIVALLEKEGYVSGQKLAEKYHVSMETIRKDLTYLEKIGVADKEYGGATLASVNIERPMDYRLDKQEEKDAIARYAVSLIKGLHTLFLDSGSTCLACVPYINRLPSMDIVTNSMRAAETLDGDLHNVFLAGGRKREKNQSLVGDWTVSFLRGVQGDACLLGTTGLLDSDGPTSHSYQELEIKKTIVEKSDIVYILAGKEKFQEKGFHTYTDWENVDGLITSPELSGKKYVEFSKKVQVMVSDKEVNQ